MFHFILLSCLQSSASLQDFCFLYKFHQLDFHFYLQKWLLELQIHSVIFHSVILNLEQCEYNLLLSALLFFCSVHLF